MIHMTNVAKWMGALGVSALLVQAGVQAQTPSQADNTAEARARVEQLKQVLRPLQADPETDLAFGFLPAESVATDGRWRGMKIETQRRATDPGGAYVWIINLRDRTYRAFRLTDPERDAERIHSYLQRTGASSSLEILRRNLEASEQQERTLREDYLQGGARAPDGAPRPRGPAVWADSENTLNAADCSGGAYAVVQTWDVASIFGYGPLTMTAISARWARIADQWNSADFGSCWANPSTVANTTWSVTYGGGYSEGHDGFVNAAKYGEYYNNDWASDARGTSVWDEAAVAYSNGFISNTMFHWDDGDWSFALFAHTYSGGSTNCSS